MDSHRAGTIGTSEEGPGVRWLAAEDPQSRDAGADRLGLASEGMTRAMKRRTRFLEI